MFNIPFISEMQDQETLDLLYKIERKYPHEIDKNYVKNEFYKSGLEYDMLSPRVQRKLNNYLF